MWGSIFGGPLKEAVAALRRLSMIHMAALRRLL